MNGGVLIIGSLLWDQSDQRVQWRQTLDLASKSKIPVPIRYGRISSSRKNTYTMVYSNSVPEHGKAYIVPFADSITCFEDLKDQAIALSYAEGISSERYPNRLAATWGAIGIKFHVDHSDNSIAGEWRDELRNMASFDPTKYAVGEESPAITEDGILNFDFQLPDGIDYVLGTPVVPNIESYPSPEQIVQAIADSCPPYEEYIRENIRHGIEEPSHTRLVELRPSLDPQWDNPKDSF